MYISMNQFHKVTARVTTLKGSLVVKSGSESEKVGAIQLTHTCAHWTRHNYITLAFLAHVSVDMITVYEYIQCQSCVSHNEKCPAIY